MSSKLKSDMYYRVYGWRYLVKATEVTAGLAESNGSLPLDGWLKVTCRLTACKPGSAPSPTLGNEYGKTLPYLRLAAVRSQPVASGCKGKEAEYHCPSGVLMEYASPLLRP